LFHHKIVVLHFINLLVLYFHIFLWIMFIHITCVEKLCRNKCIWNCT
jgi:hypothetical protein